MDRFLREPSWVTEDMQHPRTAGWVPRPHLSQHPCEAASCVLGVRCGKRTSGAGRNLLEPTQLGNSVAGVPAGNVSGAPG